MKKLPDEVACRNLILASRKRQRAAIKTKTITLKTDDESEPGKIYAILTINIRKNTQVTSLSHGLRIKNHLIHYRKNQKRSCKTGHGLELLAKQREWSRTANNRRNSNPRLNTYQPEDNICHKQAQQRKI
jgi:hypothetical protein